MAGGQMRGEQQGVRAGGVGGVGAVDPVAYDLAVVVDPLDHGDGEPRIPADQIVEVVHLAVQVDEAAAVGVADHHPQVIEPPRRAAVRRGAQHAQVGHGGAVVEEGVAHAGQVGGIARDQTAVVDGVGSAAAPSQCRQQRGDVGAGVVAIRLAAAHADHDPGVVDGVRRRVADRRPGNCLGVAGAAPEIGGADGQIAGSYVGRGEGTRDLAGIVDRGGDGGQAS